jgi:hypothetical protein
VNVKSVLVGYMTNTLCSLSLVDRGFADHNRAFPAAS